MKKLLPALFFVLATCAPAFAQKILPVHFAHGTEIFPQNFATIRQNHKVSPDEIVNGTYVRYIQMDKILNAETRAAFEAAGPKVIGYVQFGAYLVLLPQNFDFQSLERFSPHSVVAVNPSWKLANSLREQPYGEWAVRGDYLDVNMQLYPSLSIPEGASLCKIRGLEVLKEGTQNGFVQLRIHKDEIMEVADLPFVQHLELVPPPSQKEDTRGRALHRANLVASEGPFGKKYDGTGVHVLVRDDGQLGPHIDLQGRLHNYADGLPDSGTHGDGVVGIIGGAGNLDPSKKGMAIGADVYSVDYVNDFQDLTLPLHLNEGVTLTNSSYSDGCNTGYTLATQTVDQQIFEHATLMHVFSAGNSNNSNCNYGAGNQWGNITGGHKMSKNSIATANLHADASLDNTSSRGPAYDGRLKPDIAANGQNQESLDPNNGYQVFGGTSGAAPGIAGCLAQLTHAYRTIHGVEDVPTALLKATILNTANDLGNVGPDFQFGWGHINAWRALRLLEQNQWLEGDADQGDTISHTIQIPNSVKEAKIMIYWAEPPSTINNSRALINDIDLTVNSASGTVNLPWKLDPTPNPTILNTPAGKGRDSLNNMEQVLIQDPAAGTYTIKVVGTEIPMGPQHYYIVWEFLKDEIKVTYPAGGEGLVPGQVARVHWDAYGNTGTFTLRYTTDGGTTFLPITSVGGDRRMYDWTVPNTVSGKVHFLVIRGARRDTSDYPSSIVPTPQNLQVTKVCPDSLWFTWDKVNDTLSYDAYLLGQKYMEIKGTSDTNSIGIPIQGANLGKWVTVRSSYADGTAGERAIAIIWPGGLLNCPQEYDLAMAGNLSPGSDVVANCDNTDLVIRIKIQNGGLNPSTGASAFYQVDNNPPVSEAIPDIPVGESIDFEFQTPVALSGGNILLKTWVVFPGDLVDFNDTIIQAYSILNGATNQLFIENFEASPSLPINWANINPDNRFGWRTTDGLTTPVVGPDGLEGRSMHLNFYNYGPNLDGELDYLYLPPMDLTGLDMPTLTFDVAYTSFSDDYVDGLRVEVYTDCDLNAAPTTIWEKFVPDLQTVPNQSAYFYPDNKNDWRNEKIDLSAWGDQKIVVRFTSINGYGNSLYLDNIGLLSPVPPTADFTVADTVCRLDTIIFVATPSTLNATYSWNFGAGGIPPNASGIGPHFVYFPTAGNKPVRLVVSNAFGVDTLIKIVNVRHLATANFTAAQNGLTVTFTNTSSNADSYFWDFGDGNNSVETSPEHTYAAPGAYTVTLSATNPCRTHDKMLTVGVTSQNDLSQQIGVRILPNPTEGDFAVELSSRMVGDVQLNLFDAAGRLIVSKAAHVKHGQSSIAFDNLNLPKGLYQLNLVAEGKQATFSIAVQ